MNFLAIFLILLIAVSAGCIIIGILIYNRRLDKIARGEARDVHSSIPEPKTTVGVAYLIVLIAITTAALINTGALASRMTSLQNTLNNMQANERELFYELSRLREQLEEKESLLHSSSFEVLSVDYESSTVQLSYAVVLKEYMEDTSVTLQLNNRDIPLKKTQAGSFQAEFAMGLFAEYENPLLFISEDGKTMTETADFPTDIFWKFIPMPEIACAFSSGMSFGRMTYDGEYTIYAEPKDEIAKVTITYLSGGKELKTMDITKEVLTESKIQLEHGLQVEKDLTFRIEILTKSGFRVVSQSVMIYDSSYEAEENEFQTIFDANGNELWKSSIR